MISHLTSQKTLSAGLNFKSLLVMVLLMIIGGTSGWAQSKESLQQKRDELTRKIALTKKLMAENEASAKNVNQELLILKQQISYREQLINNVAREVESLQDEITGLESEIELYQQRVEALKAEYAMMIKSAYMNRHSHDAMMYILSAESFSEGYRRFKLVQNYTEVRKEQLVEIESAQQDLENKKLDLLGEQENKQELLSVQAEEKNKLAKDKQKQQKTLNNIQSQQAQLQDQQRDQEKERQRLTKKIEEIIAKELEAERNKNASGTFELSPEGKIINANFAKNKGALPWPVTRGVITKRFGKQAHPTLAGITIDSKGVDFTTEENAKVMSVFGGTVTSVFNIPGAGQNVIVTHGGYKTVYAGLKSVTVKKGDKVDARQMIGTVLTDQGQSILHFEVWNVTQSGGTPQNPTGWLAKR